jgi:hypothetical protein
MECNICQNAIFLNHSEILDFLGIFIRDDIVLVSICIEQL